MTKTVVNLQTGEIETGVAYTAQEQADIDERIASLPNCPESVTALQGMLAIDQAGLASAYDAWATDVSRTFAEKAFINKAMNWRRDDPVLLAGATALGLDSAGIDALFNAAAQL